tara:strand:+ start:300 stop:881 length:582 start_codon:yes stop_codon:yes gene_type:complete
MEANNKLTIPKILPFMCLDGVYLINNCLLPLHIFEMRYREMLDSVLNDSRIFGIAPGEIKISTSKKIYASIGIVQACKKKDNGTSDLLLIGLAKVRIKRLYFNKPYLQGEISLINNEDKKLDQNIENKIINIIKEKKPSNDFYNSFIDSFQTLNSYDAKIDYAASIVTESNKKREEIFNCIDIDKKINLLEEL